MKPGKNIVRHKDGVSEAGSGVPGGGGGSNGHVTANASQAGAGGGGDLDDLTVMDADDPSLGLTNYGSVPADDWAADTGPTRSGEASRQGVSDDLAKDSKTQGGRKIDFAPPKPKNKK